MGRRYNGRIHPSREIAKCDQRPPRLRRRGEGVFRRGISPCGCRGRSARDGNRSRRLCESPRQHTAGGAALDPSRHRRLPSLQAREWPYAHRLRSRQPRRRLDVRRRRAGRRRGSQGEPFVGRAGQLLTEIITNGMGLRRSDVYIANVVKCRPPGNRNPEPDEIAACKPFLLSQIDAVAPKVLVALGKFAAHTLLDTTLPISKLRGRWFDIPRQATDADVSPLLPPSYRRARKNSRGKTSSWSCKRSICPCRRPRSLARESRSALADMQLDRFDYELPPDRVAQHPLPNRGASRLMVLDRARGTWTHSEFRRLPEWLNPGDVLVRNDARVIRARLRGERSRGGKLEVLLLRHEATEPLGESVELPGAPGTSGTPRRRSHLARRNPGHLAGRHRRRGHSPGSACRLRDRSSRSSKQWGRCHYLLTSVAHRPKATQRPTRPCMLAHPSRSRRRRPACTSRRRVYVPWRLVESRS